MRMLTLLIVFTISTLTCACSDVKQAPKLIDADGDVHVACSGFVTISGDVQQGYEVRFTDDDGSSHDLRGIHKLEVSDPPDGNDFCPKQKKASSSSAAPAQNNFTSDSGVSEACKQARARGESMKWNEQTKKWEVSAVCASAR